MYKRELLIIMSFKVNLIKKIKEIKFLIKLNQNLNQNKFVLNALFLK